MANTALKLSSGRQYPLVAVQKVSFANILDTAVPVIAVKLPLDAKVTGGDVTVTTAFNTATTATLDIGDSTNGARYANDVDIKTAARTALTLSGYVSDGGEILITPTLVGAAATAGELTIVVEYVLANGRSHEVQPN